MPTTGIRLRASTSHASRRDASSRRCCEIGGGAIGRGAVEPVFSRGFAISRQINRQIGGTESIDFESGANLRMQLTGSATLETKREGTRHWLSRLRQLIWPNLERHRDSSDNRCDTLDF